MFRELFDRVAAIEKNTCVAVDIGDGAFTSGGCAVARVEREDPEFVLKLADVGASRADCAG